MPDEDIDVDRRVRTLEERFRRLTILGGADTNVEGSFERGYAINIKVGQIVVSTIPIAPCEIAATLVCDSISASKTKCITAFQGISGVTPPNYYLHAEFKTVCFSSAEDDPPETWFAYTDIYDVDPSDCSQMRTEDCGVMGDCSLIPLFGVNGRCNLDCQSDPSIGNIRVGNYLARLVPQDSDTDWVADSSPDPINCEVHLSDEYTTNVLCSDAVASLPPYSGTFTGDCFASRDLSDDERTCTIQRFKYKFTFPINLGPACSLCWKERFTPDVGGIVDTLRCVTVTYGMTETPVFEVLEPSVDGIVTIVYPV